MNKMIKLRGRKNTREKMFKNGDVYHLEVKNTTTFARAGKDYSLPNKQIEWIDKFWLQSTLRNGDLKHV